MNSLLSLALIAFLISPLSCKKNPSDNAQGTCKLTVKSEVWEENSHSEYVAGEGVKLSGTEYIALYHFNGSSFEGLPSKTTSPIEAIPTGTKGQYTFNRNGYDAKGWYSVLPYDDSYVRLQSDGSRVLMRLSSIQFPTTTSFDPDFDFLLGKPFDIEGNEATIELFKRMFAPLRLQISGIASEKIRSVSLSMDKNVAYDSKNIEDALTGAFYARFSEDYNKATLANLATGSVSNAVTAVYTNGLYATSGIHDIWLMVNAVNFSVGTNAKLVVCTDKNIYTFSAPLKNTVDIQCNTINNITVDLSDEAAVRQNCITTSFAGLSSASGNLELWASDGKKYHWNINATKLDYGLKMGNSAYITIPSIPGQKVVGARIYTHAKSVAVTSTDEAYLTLVNSNGNALEAFCFNQYAPNAQAKSLNTTGGVLEIALPAKYDTMSGMKILSSESSSKIISAISLITEGEPLVEGELKADGNDESTYELITNCGYNYETPDASGEHATAPFRHITQSYDDFLDKYVFNFIIHIENDDDRGKVEITDRQRNEIKTDSGSPKSMVAQDGETLRISWKFKLPAGMKTTSNFCHVHQLKGIGNDASVSTPMITYTCRSKDSGQVFQIIYRPESTSSSNDYLCSGIDLADFLGEWVSVVETVNFSAAGSFSTVITRMSDNKQLLKIDGAQRDFTRSTKPGYRPKWGIYRSLGENRSIASQMRDETLQFADFKIEKL